MTADHDWTIRDYNTKIDSGTRSDSSSGPVLAVSEAERYVEELEVIDISEIGSHRWMLQHEHLEKLNLQAHQSAQNQSDEFVLEAFLTFDKLPVLIHELLAIEAWRDNVYPLVKADLAKQNSTLRGYFLLYHEATIVNLLEVLLYHEHACSAVGDAVVELADYCARQLTALVTESERAGGSLPAPARGKALADVVMENTTEEELDRHAADIAFSVRVVSVTLTRFMAEFCARLPLSLLTRLLDTHDVLVLLVPLIENPPWTRRTDEGKWVKFVDQKWTEVAPADLLSLTKTEGQLWIALFHLMCNPECRSRYYFNSFRKETILRVRKYLNDVMLDQLPVLADVQRYMDELTIMEAPPPTSATSGGLLLETVPQIRSAIIGGKNWGDVAAAALRDVFNGTCDANDQDLRRMADLYGTDGFEELLGEAKCQKCGQTAEKRCSRCKNAWYCGRKCQVGDWKAHKTLCDLVSNTPNGQAAGGGGARGQQEEAALAQQQQSRVMEVLE